MGHRGVGNSLVAGVLVLALVACGGSDDPSPLPAAPTEGDAAVTTDEAQTASPDVTDSDTGAFGIDACTLLSAERVAAATGSDAKDGALNADLSSADQSICEWSTDAAPVAFVQVFVDESSAVSQRETTQAVLGAAQDVEVAGGADGYVIDGLVGVQVGPYFVQVNVIPADDAAALVLAEQVVAALG
jgi:hypothetical protein